MLVVVTQNHLAELTLELTLDASNDPHNGASNGINVDPILNLVSNHQMRDRNLVSVHQNHGVYPCLSMYYGIKKVPLQGRPST